MFTQEVIVRQGRRIALRRRGAPTMPQIACVRVLPLCIYCDGCFCCNFSTMHATLSLFSPSPLHPPSRSPSISLYVCRPSHSEHCTSGKTPVGLLDSQAKASRGAKGLQDRCQFRCAVLDAARPEPHQNRKDGKARGKAQSFARDGAFRLKADGSQVP